MCKNEAKLYELLNESDDPEQAVLTAIKVFSAFLEQLEEAQGLPADGLLEFS